MSSRSETRRQLLEKAHENHEEYHEKAQAKRVGPRRWMAKTEYGYDYLETIENWRPSSMQILGFLITLMGLTAIFLWVYWLALNH